MAGVRKNLFATLYGNFANIAAQLLLVPVFLGAWGTDRYGWWLVLYTIPAYFVFSDAGMANSLGNELTIAWQRGQKERAREMLCSVWKFQLLLWSGLFALFTVFLYVLPVQGWLALGSMPRFEFVACSILLCLFSLISLQLGVIGAIFRAGNRFDRFVWWNAHGKVLEVLLTMTTLWMHGGLVTVAAVIFASKAALFLYLFFSSRRVLPEVRLSLRNAPWRAFRELLPSGAGFMAYPLGAAIVNQGSAVLLNQRIGPVAVVALSVSRQLARLYLNLSNSLLVAVHPEITRAYAAGDFGRIRSLVSGALGAVFWTALPFVVVMTVLGPSVIHLWTKSVVVVSWFLVLGCGVEVVTASLGQYTALPAFASNHNLGISVVYLLSSIGALIAAALLAGPETIGRVPLCFAAGNAAYASYGYLASIRLIPELGTGVLLEAVNPFRLFAQLKTRLIGSSRTR